MNWELIHLYLLVGPTAVTKVSRMYNCSNTFRLIFSSKKSSRHFKLVENNALHRYSESQADKLCSLKNK